MTTANTAMDYLDTVDAKAFEGYLVRKDLVRSYARQYPVPTYVVAFLLGRYCGSTDFQEIEEGCLSVPGINAKVARPEKITITATNLEGEEFTLKVDNLFARAVHHENDHLDGILFIQKVSPTDEIAITGQLNELKQKYQKEKAKKEKSSPKKKQKKRRIKK